ncbi:MAG: hypothetical protein VCB63_01065, partial [Alphaproteobacteria bacterium]
YLRPRTGSIIPAFQIGVKGIKLQLKTLPDSLLELDCQRRQSTRPYETIGSSLYLLPVSNAASEIHNRLTQFSSTNKT